jgi:hypothetical protein
MLVAGGANRGKGQRPLSGNPNDGHGAQGRHPNQQRQQQYGAGNVRGGRSGLGPGSHPKTQQQQQPPPQGQHVPARPAGSGLQGPSAPLFDDSLSLAQALGVVLSRFSDVLVGEQDVQDQMQKHPQGANWRSCLEVMTEQSVRYGMLHPECPDIRLSVHVVDTRGRNGLSSQIIMVSHPAAAPFKFYCEEARAMLALPAPLPREP